MAIGNTFQSQLGSAGGLTGLSGLTSVQLLVLFSVYYIFYLIFSTVIIWFAARLVGVPKEKATGVAVLSLIIIRDLIFFALGFLPWGVGYLIGIIVWIALLKYRFAVNWGRAALIALLAVLIPLGMLMIIAAISISILLQLA